MSSIGSRLREERDRLGYNQSELAEIGGTQRKTQFNYETDARRPDADYLAAVAAAGVNMLYVLTGSTEGIPTIQITAEESQLLEHFRNAPNAVRKAAMGALLSASLGATTPTSSKILPVAKEQPSASKNQTRAPRGSRDGVKK
ncbi:MAG: helix-turn-helix domain-containing protein [Janthinobacterium lividum]